MTDEEKLTWLQQLDPNQCIVMLSDSETFGGLIGADIYLGDDVTEGHTTVVDENMAKATYVSITALLIHAIRTGYWACVESELDKTR